MSFDIQLNIQPSRVIDMKFDREIYIQLLLYILFKCYNKPNIGKTMLCNLLYFIDFNYYEQYGEMLTKETYIKSKNGIKPKHFHEITQDLIAKKQLFLRKEPYYNRIIHRYYLLVIPQVKFSKQQLQIINLSIERLSDNNATSIGKYTLKDPPFNYARLGERIDCRNVLFRNREYSIRKIKLKNK